MIQKLAHYLRYEWPLHLILLFTNWLPDNVIFLRVRGWLARPFLGRCGKDLRLGRNLVFYNPINITLGDHVFLAYGCLILAVSQITIEDEVMFGPYCVIAAGNHTLLDGSYRYGSASMASVFVGRGSWVGTHAVLTAASRVGAGSIVAAGAVVHGEYPDGMMIGGVPARVIKNV